MRSLSFSQAALPSLLSKGTSPSALEYLRRRSSWFDRDEDAVLALIDHDEAIVLASADPQAADARVAANAVVDVNDEIAALQGAVVGDGLGRAEPAIAVAALLAAEDLVVVEQG